MEMVCCQELRKVYGTGPAQVEALRGIDLRIEKGEFAAIMGPSGSGKSTLLHILGTVDKPTSGRVFVEGREISNLSPGEAAIYRRRKAEIIYQSYNLIPGLSVRDNILLPLLLDGRKPDGNLFEEITDRLGLKAFLDLLPGQLSGGQQQRTAIARGLMIRPAILLADEPTGNLDRKNSEEIVSLLKDFNRILGQTILLVTHDEGAALEADRIIMIEDGVIVGDEKRRGNICGEL